MSNNQSVLIDFSDFPKFDQINIDEIEPTLTRLLAQSREQMETLAQSSEQRTWNNFIVPMDEIDNVLERMWSPVSHLNGVKDSDELRQAYEACLPKLTEYGTQLSQDKRLYDGFLAIKNSEEFTALNLAQQKVITNALRDFRLAGVDLPEDQKARFMEIQQSLSQKCNTFSQNVLDATHGWSLHITDEKELAGLPDSAIGMARQMAQGADLKGWKFTLDAPLYIPFMTYAEHQDYRRQMYEAFTTRASDQGPTKGQWDNSQLMVEILNLRQEKAKMLGFENYADYSIVAKMADNPDQVVGFLQDLAEKSKLFAVNELAELRDFAKKQYQVDELNAWDLAYYSEKLRQQRYEFTQEEVRPYFPVEHVLKGMFEVVNRLFGISIKQTDNDHLWHDDVRFFEVKEQGQVIGHFYVDLFAREHKRGGAWMADCMGRMQTKTGLQKPVAFLTCNFSLPVGDKPSLLTHDEVTTLFHEFGHGLHHLLTRIDEPGVAGINGVAWDAVELPSQFMENWCWEHEGLNLISSHYETGEILPEELLAKMKAAKNFHSAMGMLRQLEFSLFDILLHQQSSIESPQQIQTILNQVRSKVAVITPPDFNRFQHAFSHIFAGGYAAGYYSYKWAEVLSADAFSRFEEEGVFNADTGQLFREVILANGGSREPMELFVEFRGREPDIEALLKHSGLLEQAA